MTSGIVEAASLIWDDPRHVPVFLSVPGFLASGSNACSRIHMGSPESLNSLPSRGSKLMAPARAPGSLCCKDCCRRHIATIVDSTKLGSQDELQLPGKGNAHQPSRHSPFTEDEDGGVLPHTISSGQAAMLRPVGAETLHAPLALPHDVLEAAPDHLAPLTVPLREVEKDRQRRGQHRRLERCLLKFLDRAGCCHQATHGCGPFVLIESELAVGQGAYQGVGKAVRRQNTLDEFTGCG